MKDSEHGWIRGAVVIGLAAAMMAVALLSPALAVRLATTSYVKAKVNAATASLTAQINAGDAATRNQTFVRSAAIVVPASSAVAGEIACPVGMIATGGGATVSNSSLVMNDSAPTDGTGAFPASFGLAGGAGYTAWGAIVTSTGGAGSFRVYASCRTGTQTGSNYASGVAALRLADASAFTSG
jgi:hypothetical protein